jgi:hypothetical protein
MYFYPVETGRGTRVPEVTCAPVLLFRDSDDIAVTNEIEVALERDERLRTWQPCVLYSRPRSRYARVRRRPLGAAPRAFGEILAAWKTRAASSRTGLRASRLDQRHNHLHRGRGVHVDLRTKCRPSGWVRVQRGWHDLPVPLRGVGGA